MNRWRLRLPASYSAQEGAELMGVAVAYHYINRLVNVFLAESLLPPLLRGARLGDLVWSQVGQRLARGRDQIMPHGTSLRFLPSVELPTELSWAAVSPSMSRAFAGWATLVEQKGAEVLSQRVRRLVIETLHPWQGEPVGLSRVWVERAIAGLTGADQAAGRLALLTAFASYQVDAKTIKAFRAHYATDAQLVGAVAWASVAAARKITSWLQVPPGTGNHPTMPALFAGPEGR